MKTPKGYKLGPVHWMDVYRTTFLKRGSNKVFKKPHKFRRSVPLPTDWKKLGRYKRKGSVYLPPLLQTTPQTEGKPIPARPTFQKCELTVSECDEIVLMLFNFYNQNPTIMPSLGFTVMGLNIMGLLKKPGKVKP